MRIAVTPTNTIPAVEPAPAPVPAPPVAPLKSAPLGTFDLRALTGLGEPFVFKSIFPIKLADGTEFTGADALRLGRMTPPGWKFDPSIKLPSLASPPPAGKHVLGAAPLPVGYLVKPGLAAPRIVAPGFAATRSTNPKLLQGLRDFTTFFAAHCGKGVKVAHDLAWLGHDFVVFYRDLKDPEVHVGERVVEIAELGSGVLSVLGAITGSEGLDQASGSFHFVSVIGGHLNSGNVVLTQSELVSLSALPEAEKYAALLDGSEILQQR